VRSGKTIRLWPFSSSFSFPAKVNKRISVLYPGGVYSFHDNKNRNIAL
jgi:hypothetical protein